MNSLKADLWARLQAARTTILTKIDGLSEYDARRAITPSGTNLLGLVKHLAGEEYGYLGETFGRPPAVRPGWFRDDPADEVDMWATPDESTAYIVGTYRDAARHADETIRALDLDSPGSVPHWAQEPDTTLGAMMVLMVGETAQHAGHADTLRELIDGCTSHPNLAKPNQHRRVQEAAEAFKTI